MKKTLLASWLVALAIFCFCEPQANAASFANNDGDESTHESTHGETQNQGDLRSIKFTVPFKEALKKAKQENRLIFLKPIFGGVDQLGARDYRCGSW